jgi:hypothetical protein
VIARLVAASHVAIDLSRDQVAGDFIQQRRFAFSSSISAARLL